MTDWTKLKIPSKERLNVQLLDGTDQHNIKQIITSIATIKGDTVTYLFKLYKVNEDGSLTLLEKNSEPVFKNEGV